MRATGTLIPKGPKRKAPFWRSSRAPKTLGESNRGTQSQSTAPSGATRAPVWQLERKPYSAIGGKGEGAAALWGAGAPAGLLSVRSPRAGFSIRLGFAALMTPPTARRRHRRRTPPRTEARPWRSRPSVDEVVAWYSCVPFVLVDAGPATRILTWLRRWRIPFSGDLPSGSRPRQARRLITPKRVNAGRHPGRVTSGQCGTVQHPRLAGVCPPCSTRRR